MSKLNFGDHSLREGPKKLARQTKYSSLPKGTIVSRKPKVEGIRCVAFDFGGVLTATDIMGPVFKAYKREHGEDIIPFWKRVHDSKNWRNFFTGSVTEQEFWDKAMKEFRRPDFDFQLFSRSLRHASADIDPRMESLVSRLRSLGYKTVMLTNNSREWFDFIKNSNRLTYFDSILTSYDLGVMKPDLAIYRAMLGIIGAKPEECVFIDDFEQNSEGARQVGIHTITFKTMEQARRELESVLGHPLVIY